ncbi:hypothetical protein AVEN_37349-1, partial [Araneus ventricosus]
MPHIPHDGLDCGLGSSLTGPQPTGLFLLESHEIFRVRDACGLSNVGWVNTQWV